ncbi:hypothetical protein HRbin19_00618 [bacterium HR19]|nr:hypothetical protein HRbin19_00618 [bacterium HR19]
MRKSDIIFCFILGTIPNLAQIYSLFVLRQPLYFHYDEAIWVKQTFFCGKEFPFYEQKWGLIIPSLCLIYPLKFIIHPYFFPSLRIIFTIINFILAFKILNLYLPRRTSYIILLFISSNIFSSSKLILYKTLEILEFSIDPNLIRFTENNLISNIYGNTLRVFNPSYFMIFFLLFFLAFSSAYQEQEKDIENRKKIATAGVLGGLIFYSHPHWFAYTISTLTLTLFIYFISKKETKSIAKIIFSSLIVGLPGIIFNLYQREILKESIKRGAMMVTIENQSASIPKEFLVLFALAIISILLFSKYRKKDLFLLGGVLSGLILFIVEPISRIYTQIIPHITVPFKIFSKIAIGFSIKKIEEKSKPLINIPLFLFIITFISQWIFFSFRIIRELKDEKIEKINEFIKVAEFIKTKTEKNSVITAEDLYGFFFIYDVFPTSSELMLSILTKRYILHNNINYFSDLKDEDIFERFILRAKLLGYSGEELKKYIKDISEREHVVWGTSTFSVFVSRAYFGTPPNFTIEKYKNLKEALPELTEKILQIYKDEEKMNEILKKLKVDYVVRKKDYQGEPYLEKISEIGDFKIMKVVK